MDDRRDSRGLVPRPGVTWPLFGAASSLVLGACLVGALATGSWPRALMILAGALLAIGLTAAWMVAILSPLPGYRGPRARRPGQGVAIAGVADGGGGDAGCGDGGGC